MPGPGPERSAGGSIPAAIADSINITRASDQSDPKYRGYVLIVSEIVVDDLDQPVKRLAYRADPEQARIIAASLIEQADLVEQEQS